MDGQDGRLGNLLVAGGCDEVDAGSPEGTLASDDARFISGQTLIVDGGFSLPA